MLLYCKEISHYIQLKKCIIYVLAFKFTACSLYLQSCMCFCSTMKGEGRIEEGRKTDLWLQAVM